MKKKVEIVALKSAWSSRAKFLRGWERSLNFRPEVEVPQAVGNSGNQIIEIKSNIYHGNTHNNELEVEKEKVSMSVSPPVSGHFIPLCTVPFFSGQA